MLDIKGCVVYVLLYSMDGGHSRPTEWGCNHNSW